MDRSRCRAALPPGDGHANPARPSASDPPPLTSDATRILDATIIQTYTPNNFAWESLTEPDMSDGWASP